MLYESIANSLVESVNADKPTLAYTLIDATISDANDRNEARNILTQCVKGRISDPDTEERLITFIQRTWKDNELDRMEIDTGNPTRQLFALNGQVKTLTSQLDNYKSQVNKNKLKVWLPSIVAIGSLTFAGVAIGQAIKANDSLNPTKRALEELSQKYSALNDKHQALNQELSALQLQNQELLKGNQELEKAFEPTKKENQRLAEENQAASEKNASTNDRLSRVCKRKRNWFFNKDCK